MVECSTRHTYRPQHASAFCQGTLFHSFRHLYAHPNHIDLQVVDSVLVINPGTLSKRRAPGTYAQMAVHPRAIPEAEREEKQLDHKLYERARVDINRI